MAHQAARTRPAALIRSAASFGPARRGALWLTISIVIVAIIAVLLVFWMMRPGPDVEQHRKERSADIMRGLGLAGAPVQNAMSADFKDADGDLVADAPTDPAKQADPDTLYFSYIAEPKLNESIQDFKPWVEYLSQVTGKKVELAAFPSINDELLALRDGKLHICAFNTGAVPLAVNAAGFVPVAVLGGDSGESSYKVKIIVPDDSPMKSVEDLKGHELTFVELSSNSGFKAPVTLLMQKGLELSLDYQFRFSQSHDNSIEGIASKTYEAAAVASDALDRAQKAGTINASQYRVIYESPDSYPTAAFGYSHSLTPALAAKVKQGLMEFKWDGNSVGKRFAGQTKLIAVNYKDRFAKIRDIDNAFGFEHKITEVTAESPTTIPTTRP